MADDDNLNIFEEFYESIKPGGSFDKGAVNVGKAVTDVFTPNQQTQDEMAQYEQSQQDALNTLYAATGIDPKSLEGQNLEKRLQTDTQLQELMGFDKNLLKELKFDFAKAGQFLFGDANLGLTTMKDTGATYKSLPFEQKLGIALLPIDALDVIGLGALAKGGLGALIKAGVKTYGRKSGKTVQDLLNDDELVSSMMKQNPSFMDDLDELGLVTQKRFATGKKKRGPTPTERDEGIDLFGTQTTKPKLDITQGKVDDSLARFAKEAEELKLKTDEFKSTLDQPQLTAGGIETKPGQGKGSNPNPTRGEGTKAKGEVYGIKTRNVLSDDQKIQLDDILERIRKGELNAKDGAALAHEFAPDFPFYSPEKIKRGEKGVASDKWGKIVSNYNNQFDDELFKTVSKKYARKSIKEVNEAIKIADGMPDTDLAGNEIDFGMKFANAYKNLTKPGEIIPKDGMRRLFGGNWENTKQLADEILNLQGRKETAFLKFPKNSYRTKDGKNLEYQTFGGDIGKNTLDEAFALAKLNANQQGAIRDFKNRALETAGKSNRDENYINQIAITSALDRFIKNAVARNATGREILDVLNGVDAAEFGKVINKQRRLRNLFDKLKDQGIDDIENFDLSHMEAVADNWKTALDANNLFFTTVAKNRGLQKELNTKIVDVLRQIKSLEETKPIGAEARIAKLKEEFESLGNELKRLNIVSVIDGKKIGSIDMDYLSSAERIESDMLERQFDEMTFPKDMDLYNKGGLVENMDDIFDTDKFKPFIDIQFGEQSPAAGKLRRFGDKPTEDPTDMVEKEVSAPAQRMFDVEPMEENMFAEPMSGNVETTNLILPFYKLFTKPPINETAPIPTPKESLGNPTKKQKQSLEQEKINKQDDVFDPTPEDNKNVDLGSPVDVAVTPKTNTAVTGVFYSDIERVLQRPDTPAIFPNKQILLDLLRKNRIKNTEFDDYQLESLLRAYDDNTPIPKQQVIDHIRRAPIRGLHVHATGEGSNIINPGSRNVDTRYTGYAAEGFIPGSQRERVLYIPKQNLRGDSGAFPTEIFQGEDINRHKFGIPNEEDSYIVGWTRLTDRFAILPTKIQAPKTQSKVPGMTRERERLQRQVAGLYAEAINKLNREGVRRGLNQADLDEINQLSFEQMLTQYGDTLNDLSPGLLDQIDETIVKVTDLDSEIAKGSTVDTSGIVKVAFADEIQSDIMQAAAGRKQKLLATVRKIQEEGRDSTTLPELSRVGKEALAFFEENKSVFRPLAKSETEVNLIGEQIAKADAEIDEIISRYIDTRELDPGSVKRVQTLINENVQNLIDEIISIDTKTYDGLFPDLPFKKREEWADALIKKDLFELAYRKFVLKDPDVPDYYSVTPEDFVIQRYSFQGNSATSAADRAADKAEQIRAFTRDGQFKKSRYRGIGMSEFYGGPNAKDQNGKHYTSVIEKILKNQAKSNNSEFTVLNVQTKSGGKDVFIVKDQNGNMVATLTSRDQATRLSQSNPNYRIETQRVPDSKSTTPSFAIKITEEMLEPYKTHKAKGGLVQMIDIFEVA